jgi:hypothetical protein
MYLLAGNYKTVDIWFLETAESIQPRSEFWKYLRNLLTTVTEAKFYISDTQCK